MNSVTVNGIVIRETDYSDNDKILNLLTAEMGLVPVTAKGVKSLKNINHAAAQLMVSGEFSLHRKGDRYWLKEAYPKENFFAVRSNIDVYSLCVYLLELTESVAVQDEPAETLLSLLLNTLYVLANGLKPERQVKAAFEMRLLSESGFCPDLSGCSQCGKEDGEMMLDVLNGCLVCHECGEELDGRTDPILPVSPSVRMALRYLVSCPVKRLFAFSLDEDDLAALGRITESYALNHLERGFRTLDFYKSVKNMKG